MNVKEAVEAVLCEPLDTILTKCPAHDLDEAVIFALTTLEEFPEARADCGDRLETITAVLKAWAHRDLWNCGLGLEFRPPAPPSRH
jgi:hypothetical protein